MKERKLFRYFIVLLIVGFVGAFLNQHVLASSVINLNYASYQPHTSDSYKAQEWWVGELEKRSEGKVKIRMFPGQSLVKAKEMLETVSKGGVDIVGAASVYHPGEMPIHNLIGLPMAIPERVDQQMLIFNSDELKHHPAFINECNSLNIVNLYKLVVPTYCIASNRRVATPADLKGLKLRSTGLVAELLKKFGVTAVYTSAPETLMAMTRGVVEGAMCAGAYWIKAYKIDDAAKYITKDIAFGGASLDILMNKAVYEKLPPDVKTIINDLRHEMALVLHLHLQAPHKLLKWHMENERKGITYVYWKKEDVRTLQETAVPIWKEWQEKWQAKGSKEYFAAFTKKKEEVLKKYPNGLPIQYKY
jgi:TRAP-type C4-dicarboxylate transport system substrate-binding protein